MVHDIFDCFVASKQKSTFQLLIRNDTLYVFCYNDLCPCISITRMGKVYFYLKYLNCWLKQLGLCVTRVQFLGRWQQFIHENVIFANGIETKKGRYQWAQTLAETLI